MSSSPSGLESGATNLALLFLGGIAGVVINAASGFHMLAQVVLLALIAFVLLLIASWAKSRREKADHALAAIAGRARDAGRRHAIQELMTPEARALLAQMLAAPDRAIIRSEGRSPKILITRDDVVDHESAGSVEGYLRWQAALETLVKFDAARSSKDGPRTKYVLAPNAAALAKDHPPPDGFAIPLTPRLRRQISLSERLEQKRRERGE